MTCSRLAYAAVEQTCGQLPLSQSADSDHIGDIPLLGHLLLSSLSLPSLMGHFHLLFKLFLSIQIILTMFL